MSDSIVKQIAGLHRLTGHQLKERWRELYGTEPPGYNRTFLIKRLAYRLQELTYGRLSEAAHAKMRGILRDAGLTEDGLSPGKGRLARRSRELPTAGTGVQLMSEIRCTTVVERDDHIVIRIPLTLKRRAGCKEVIVEPPPSTTPTRRRQNVNPLMVAVARAHRWEELLESGRYGSWVEIASAQGVAPSYVARILRLTLLAPDIVECILDGTEPDGLSLGKLYQLPMDWDEQRRALAAGGNGQR